MVDKVERPARTTNGVQSVERTFALLELLAAAGGESSVSELAAGSGLPQPTIHRLVRTLVDLGYVRQLPSRRYSLGAGLIHLGDSASGMLAAMARPRLGELVEAVGETANLSMLDGDKVVYVAQVQSRHAMRMFTEVGRRVHLHSTGVGKVLLAQLDDRAVATLVDRVGLPAQTDRSITDPQAFAAEIRRARRRGYAVDDGEQELGVRCVAVPVLDAPGAFALSVSGPAVRMTAELVDRAVPALQSAASRLAGDLAADRANGASGDRVAG